MNANRIQYPFLLGTTSYIIPESIIPNVRMLAPLVDDIELVLFESDAISNLPSKREIAELKSIAESYNAGFTIHLPTDRKAGSASTTERQGFRDAARRVIDLTSPLTPHGWVLHLEGITFQAAQAEIDIWKTRCLEIVSDLSDATGASRLIAIENLAYPFACNVSIASECNTMLCLDVGHLWVAQDQSWKTICKDVLSSTSIIHLHGVESGNDHISLRRGNDKQIELFLDMLKDYSYTGVLTLEVFNQKDFTESMEVIREIWEK